jgi:secreted trypsin-like serine protease
VTNLALRALLPALVLLLALPAAAGAARIQGSVVGGTPAAIEDWPFIAALVVKGQPADRGQFCGGSVADATHVITAAHCIEGESAPNVQVVVGHGRLADAGDDRVQVAAIAVHPSYDGEGSNHDIAILRLAQPLAAPVPITPASPDEAGLAAAGQPVRVAGWGLINQNPNEVPSILQQAPLSVVGPNRCRKAYGSDFDTALMICAGTPDVGPPDSCSGDSGGPLVADGPLGPRLVGVVSYGSDTCGDPQAPGAYTRVSAESAFVGEQLGGAPPPPLGDAPAALDPRVEIGRIWCGSRCYVEVGATGPGVEALPALKVRVRRARKGTRKAFDKTYSAKRLSNTRWRAKVGLPLGSLKITARAFDASGRTIGTGDSVRIGVVP